MFFVTFSGAGPSGEGLVVWAEARVHPGQMDAAAAALFLCKANTTFFVLVAFCCPATCVPKYVLLFVYCCCV